MIPQEIITTKTLPIYSKQGIYFAIPPKGYKRKSVKILSNLRALCLMLEKNIGYFIARKDNALNDYLDAQFTHIKAANVVVENLSQQIEDGLGEDVLQKSPTPLSTLKVTWSLDASVILDLMSLFIIADRLFFLLAEADKKHLADSEYISKNIRHPLTQILLDCFSALIKTHTEFKDKRKGGLYSITLPT